LSCVREHSWLWMRPRWNSQSEQNSSLLFMTLPKR